MSLTRHIGLRLIPNLASAFGGSSSAVFKTYFSTKAATHADTLGKYLDEQLNEIRNAGTYKNERIITSSQAAEITVVEGTGPVLNFCANNYLGLSNDKKLIEAAKKALDTHGLGLSSVRFICGTQDIHKELEKLIAEFHGKDDTILFPSCFDANGGIFEAILTPEDAVISDELNHASIIDGIRLCKAQKKKYKHLDMSDLEKCLQEAQDARTRLIATDGVFSMDGDIAPLDKICALADKYDARIFIDECHATGFLGKTGRGTPEIFGVQDRIDVIHSTLGKALGGATGGYSTAIQGRKDVIDMLRQKARPYLFSNSIAPPVVGASIEVFKTIMHDTSLKDTLQANIQLFRSRMKEAGFRVLGNEQCPICPVLLNDAKITSEFADEMLKKGIYVIGFSFPVVPRGQARIRVQLSAAHSLEQVNKAVDAFIEVGKKKGVIS